MKISIFLFFSMLLNTALVFAGGDLLVDGKLGVGTPSPRGRIDVGGYLGFGKGIRAGDYLEINEREKINNSATITFNAFIAADDGTYLPAYAPGTGMIMSMASGGYADIDFWGKNWSGSSVPASLDSFTHVMRLSTNGNIGVGTKGPQSRLHILGSDWNGLTLTSASNINKIGTLKYDPVGTYVAGKSFLILSDETTNTDSTNAGIMFRTNNGQTGGYTNPVMVIRESGNVGVGTTTPLYKLDVSGQVASNGVVLTSDSRFKKNLQPIISPIDKILNLSGLTYEWKTDEYKNKGFAEGRHYGVIAQEVEKVLPEVVKTDSKGEKSVAYTEIIPVLIEAIKEQQKLIEKQQAVLTKLQNANENQQKQIAELRQIIK